MTPRCRPGEYFAECRPAHHEGSAAPRRGLAGLRCPRRGCCLWRPAVSRGLVSHAPRRVLRLASVAGGALTPQKRPLPGRRRCDDPWRCNIARSTRVRPSCWRRRERWPGAPVRALAARRNECQCQAVSFGARAPPLRLVLARIGAPRAESWDHTRCYSYTNPRSPRDCSNSYFSRLSC